MNPLNPEYTLCGHAFDSVGEVDAGDYESFQPTDERTVTCSSCLDVISFCSRGGRFVRDGTMQATMNELCRTAIGTSWDYLAGVLKGNPEYVPGANETVLEMIMTSTDLQAIAAELMEAGDVVGFRFVDHAVAVGDELSNSFVWDGDDKTDDELPGTCAFEGWTAMATYAQYSRGCGKIVAIRAASSPTPIASGRGSAAPRVRSK